MSENVELTNPVDLSVGGMSGHVFRRAIHIGMSAIPIVFFEFGDSIADAFNSTTQQAVSIIILTVLAVEGVRLKLGFTIFGQREYEAHQVSALAWGSFAVGMVFLLAPHEAYAWPIVLSLSLGDPFMGELRRRGMDSRNVIMYSCVFLISIWLTCWHFFATPFWLAFLLGPLCVVSEWPRLRYIDDNATMVLIPLGAVLLLEPFLLVTA